MEANIPDSVDSLSKSDRRRARILQMLMSGTTAQIRDLAAELRVSLMTVHRDLAELEKEGLVRRLRGAVSAEKSLLFESSRSTGILLGRFPSLPNSNHVHQGKSVC